jgi:hypothetical protein
MPVDVSGCDDYSSIPEIRAPSSSTSAVTSASRPSGNVHGPRLVRTLYPGT